MASEKRLNMFENAVGWCYHFQTVTGDDRIRLAGFELINRMEFRDKRSGRMYR